MRVFVAGGSGVLGVRLVPLLLAAGHDVAAMTRSPAKVPAIEALGATAVVGDAFDLTALTDVVCDFAPTAVFHSLTHLPDDRAEVADYATEHRRTLREGTRNLVAAAERAGVAKIVAQSLALPVSGPVTDAYAELERLVLEADGVVLRFGAWYGPGTWNDHGTATSPRIHIDTAAQRAMEAFALPTGVYVVAEDEPGAADADKAADAPGVADRHPDTNLTVGHAPSPERGSQ